MRQHRAEPLGAAARAVRHDLGNQTSIIVVQNRLRQGTEERKPMDMTIQPSLGVRGRIGADVTGIAVRQIKREEVGLLLHTTDDNQSFAKVGLRMSGRMAQRYEHLPRTTLRAPHLYQVSRQNMPAN